MKSAIVGFFTANSRSLKAFGRSLKQVRKITTLKSVQKPIKPAVNPKITAVALNFDKFHDSKKHETLP